MIQLNVNGKTQDVDADPDTPLLWVLRDELQLTGTKYGCGVGQCGACTVLLDGRPIHSCRVRLSAVGNGKITTIEGIQGAAAQAVTAAWRKLDVVQCGYCQSGQIVAATDLLTRKAQPTDSDIDEAMAGNICRCGTYQRIRAAIHEASAIMAGRASEKQEV